MLVIDPGHGGKNIGCQANGLVEKDLTLALAGLLRRLCVAAGIPVALTREDDGTYSFTQRLLVARRKGATQILSLHFDANPSPGVGRQTCYCERTDERSCALARQVLRTAPLLLAGVALPIYVEQEGWKKRAHNVVSAYRGIPTLLVECAFVTSPLHAAYIKGPGLTSIAAALLAGIAAAQ